MFKNKKDKVLLEEKAREIEGLEDQLSILKGIQDAMPDPYFVRDMDYNIILWPDAIAELTGYSEDEAKNIKYGDLFKVDVCKDYPSNLNRI